LKIKKARDEQRPGLKQAETGAPIFVSAMLVIPLPQFDITLSLAVVNSRL
jgi:hypothetical protein